MTVGLPDAPTAAEFTLWTTSAVEGWLWRRGARIIAREVGMSARTGLTTPWLADFRADVVGVEARKRGARALCHAVEVKGHRADLKREDRCLAGARPGAMSKWQTPWHERGICAWLALGPGCGLGSTRVAEWIGTWGILCVDRDGAVSVLREPKHVDELRRGDFDAEAAAAWLSNVKAMASTMTSQAMPQMMGRTMRQATVTIFERRRRRDHG